MVGGAGLREQTGRLDGEKRARAGSGEDVRNAMVRIWINEELEDQGEDGDDAEAWLSWSRRRSNSVRVAGGCRARLSLTDLFNGPCDGAV